MYKDGRREREVGVVSKKLSHRRAGKLMGQGQTVAHFVVIFKPLNV